MRAAILNGYHKNGGTRSLGAMAIPVAKSMKLNVITNGSAEKRLLWIRYMIYPK